MVSSGRAACPSKHEDLYSSPSNVKEKIIKFTINAQFKIV
jgi:hypothetical protein